MSHDHMQVEEEEEVTTFGSELLGRYADRYVASDSGKVNTAGDSGDWRGGRLRCGLTVPTKLDEKRSISP